MVGAPGAGPVHVSDPEGAYLGTLARGFPGLPVLFLPNGRVGFVEEDALGVQRLVVGRVMR